MTQTLELYFVEGHNITALDIFIYWFSCQIILNKVVHRHQVIHNGKHNLQFLYTISNRNKLGCKMHKFKPKDSNCNLDNRCFSTLKERDIHKQKYMSHALHNTINNNHKIQA
uniref:Translational elongation factor 1 subunit Bbeta n=1 Tax=Rhizophora mucronata TaxID=61149 RepID=A0A2P2LA07_RHIMU